MSRPLLVANAAVRLALKACFEADTYEFQTAGLLFLHLKGLDRYAAARVILRHLSENRKLYCKYDDKGVLIPRNFHGEVALRDDDQDVAYMQFSISQSQTSVWVRAHENRRPSTLPW